MLKLLLLLLPVADVEADLIFSANILLLQLLLLDIEDEDDIDRVEVAEIVFVVVGGRGNLRLL